jgi:conjugative transfer signal peptidase TraF
MTKILFCACLGAVVGVSAVRVMAALGVLIVHTPSIAEGVYLRSPVGEEGPLQVGDVVCLEGTSVFAPSVLREGIAAGRFPAAWRIEPLVKHVAALGGDEIAYELELGVLVNGEALPNSVRKSADLEGKRLPSPAMPGSVPAGHVWLTSTHPDGFDSRYVGPIDVRALSCVAEPLWMF